MGVGTDQQEQRANANAKATAKANAKPTAKASAIRQWLKLSWVEAKLFLREPEAFFFTMVFPVLLLLLYGSIFGNKPTVEFGGRGVVDVSVPCYMALVMATSALMSLPIAVAQEREKGVLRRFRVTPLRSSTVLAAWVAVYFAVAVLGGLALIILGKLLYGLHFWGNVLGTAAAFTLGTLSLFAFGFIVASLARSGRAASVVAMAFYFPMIFLSGATYPWEMLPRAVQRVGEAMPLTYVVRLMKGMWFGDPWSAHWVSALVLVGVLVAGVGISARIFRWE